MTFFKAVPLCKLIRGFARSYAQLLPREQGYPNSFLLLLTGLWYAERRVADGPEQLYRGWLSWLTCAKPQRVDVSREVSTGPERHGCWEVVEPVERRTACALSVEQLGTLKTCARMELQKHKGEGLVARWSHLFTNWNREQMGDMVYTEFKVHRVAWPIQCRWGDFFDVFSTHLGSSFGSLRPTAPARRGSLHQGRKGY